MTPFWKGNQCINHGNNIKQKTLVLVEDKSIQFSQWKCNSITNIMRGKYKSGNNGIEKIVVNSIYNLMKLRDDMKVFIINKNNTATVMNEKDIKTSIRMYFRLMYDVNNSGIEKFNNSMTFDKYNVLVNSVHSSWCNRLLENKGNNYDISLTYDLCNHVKVPTIKRTSSK